MSAIRMLTIWGTLLLLIGAPALAQMSDMSGDDTFEDAELALPDNEFYCAGDKCPGQTCDEVNDRCVGSVTLQQPMGAPLLGLKKKELQRFELGKVQFDRSFTDVEGLGPVFNDNSCGSCHNNPLGGSGTITVTRFGNIQAPGPGPFDLTFDPLESLGGSLLNKETIAPGCEETIPIPETNYANDRVTNSALGFGLVEAIADADIEFNELNPPAPGISGRVHIVPVLEEPGQTAVGRFGWKNQLATVLSFSADAMVEEMGITNRILTEDNAPNADLVRLAACDTVADPEDVPDAEGGEFIDRVTDFQRFLAPPPQTPRSGMTGEAIFNSIGCADCHLSSPFVTPDSGVEKAMRNQEVNAYSDFLLHEMGFNADLIEQGGASMFEIRTTLLWGLRVRDPMWHDGRVAGGTFDFRIQNVVALHNTDGSEAKASAIAYNNLSPADKEAVIAFLDSLGKREFDMDGDGNVDDSDALAVNDCSLIDVEITPDDPCAVADVDQDGDVDADDLELLDVALGVVDPDEDGDDEDEDVDDEAGDDGNIDKGDLVATGDDAGGPSDLSSGDPVAEETSDNEEVIEVEEDRRTKRAAPRQRISRRGL